MKNVFKIMTLAAGGLLLSEGAFAQPTVAGVSISNTAAVDYDVGGIAQTQIESAADAFLVDRLVNFSVVKNQASINVTPGSVEQVLAFTVTNNSNAILDFNLAAIQAAGDDFDATGSAVFVESGATAGYQSGEDLLDYVDELAISGTRVVYIVSSIDISRVNDDEAIVHLEATAASGGVALTEGSALSDDAGNADIAGTVQNVFNDDGLGTAPGEAAKNGKDSDSAIYIVETSELTITKTSSVISDPVNGGTNPKRIPGAVVQYVITVANGAGGADADAVIVTDALPADTVFADSNAYGGEDMEVAGVGEDASDGGDAGDYNVTNAGSITADLGTITGGSNKTVRFRVTIE